MAGRKQNKQTLKRAKKAGKQAKRSKRADRSDEAFRKFIASTPKPKGKFNKWAEKKWITATEEQLQEAERIAKQLKLSKRARCLFEAAFFTNSEGIEFVFISNAQFFNFVQLRNGTLIVPCFYPVNFYEPANVVDDARHSAMFKTGTFIYDGWKPIEDWTSENLESAICELDDLVNLFSVIGIYHAHWEPKYDFAKKPTQVHWVFPDDLNSLQQTIDFLDRLDENDRQALRLSSAWIADALRDESYVQRFILLFLSLESLITYIERKASDDSPLRAFAGSKMPKQERSKVREDCINQIWKETEQKTEAITRAYFACVQTNRGMIEANLTRVFEDASIARKLFSEEIDGKTLWQLRNDIAHGSIDILTDDEVRRAAKSQSLIEGIARGYLRIIISKLASQQFFKPPRRPGFVIPAASHAIGEPGSKSTAPTDMAELYGNLSAISSAYVSSTAGQSVRFRF